MVMGVGGSKKSAEQFASVIARIKDDIEAMEKSVESMAVQMGKAAQASQNIKTGGVGGGGTGAGNTGKSQDQGLGLAEVREERTRSIGRQAMGDALGAVATFIPNAMVGAVNDLRVGRETAQQFEMSNRIARVGTGDFGKLRGLVSTAMNDFNVQNRAVLERDVAMAMRGGWGAGFGGGQEGMTKAAQAMGGLHSLATLSGVNPEAVSGMGNALYSSGTYYKAMAAGIQTRDAQGNMVSAENIVNQYYNTRLQGKSRDEVMRALQPGGGLRAELEQTFGDPAMVESLVTGMMMTVEQGGTIAEGDLEKAAKNTGYAGTEATKMADSESKLQKSEQERIMEFAPRVADGVEAANRHLTSINDQLTARGADSWVGTIEQVGGYLDGLNDRLGETTGSINNLISSLGSAGIGAMTSRFFGGGRKNGTATGRRATAPGTAGGRLAKPGMGTLKGGVASVAGTAASFGVNWLADNASGESWDAVDTAGLVAGRAGSYALTGAGIGGMIGSVVPVIGTGIGAGIGAAIGGIWGGISGWNESRQRRGYSEGTPFVTQDQTANIHYGEMILPNRIAEAVRTELANGRAGMSKSSGTTVVINVNVARATDAEAMRMVRIVKSELENDRELVAIGSGKTGF